MPRPSFRFIRIDKWSHECGGMERYWRFLGVLYRTSRIFYNVSTILPLGDTSSWYSSTVTTSSSENVFFTFTFILFWSNHWASFVNHSLLICIRKKGLWFHTDSLVLSLTANIDTISCQQDYYYHRKSQVEKVVVNIIPWKLHLQNTISSSLQARTI